MPDPVLRATVRGELGLLPETPLTTEKMLRLDSLDVHDKGILDITGLEFATNLRAAALGAESNHRFTPARKLNGT